MRDYHTSPYLHANLADIYIDCHLEQPPTGDMFQRKIDKIFKDLPNLFGITDNILVVGYDRDGKDHDETLQRVLQVSRQVNLKTK